MKVIVSFSGGKDSTFMLLEMIRRKEHIDEVVFFDTGWEFPQMYAHVEKVRKIVEQQGITFTTLHPEKSFDYLMFNHQFTRRDGTKCKGYSWCGGRVRWGTTEKNKAISRHFKSEPEHIQCVGIAADETDRLIKERTGHKRYPLAEWGITEAECLQGCYELGFDWGGLYEQLDRVSCKFCGNKNLKELRNIYKNMPDVWQELKDYERRTDRPFKSDRGNISDFEKRFELEKEFEAQGKSVKSKEFFTALKEATAHE